MTAGPGVTEAERLARVALNRLAEPGDPRLAVLLDELGPLRLQEALLGELDLHGLRTDVALRLDELDPARELEQAERVGLRFVVPGDTEWPESVDALGHAGELQERGGVPVGLWVRGPLRLDQIEASVAVVGSRAATTYGTAVGAGIAAAVGRAGFAVVSGGAFGIDVAAHRGALAAGAPTVSVLACGADRSYPQAHRELLDTVAATGAVVSEAAPGCAPLKMRFLARNRIIAALTRGTVVVEAAARSGALNTANWAGRVHRQLMGVPGPVTSAASGGVHEQIRRGAMTLVTSGADVLDLLGASGEHLVPEPRGPVVARDALSPRQLMILDAVPVHVGAPPDSISRVAGIGLLEVGRVLAALQDRGLVARDDTGWVLASA